jgi:hypothetical protein
MFSSLLLKMLLAWVTLRKMLMLLIKLGFVILYHTATFQGNTAATVL